MPTCLKRRDGLQARQISLTTPILPMLFLYCSRTPFSLWCPQPLVQNGVLLAMATILSAPSETMEEPARAILFASLAGAGFVTTFAPAQAAISGGANVQPIFVSRASTTTTIGIFLVIRAQASLLPSTILPRLGSMGLLDVSALSLVTIFETFPHPQLAAGSASLFGTLTIVLARIFWCEPMSSMQWITAALVFSGIGVLGLY